MAKSSLFKGLTKVLRTYERPDSGSYQLELMIGKELVFLNDFEYDDDAKKFMSWGYFKRFLEGGSVPVGWPKNRGSDVVFDKDSPVLMTAPQKVSFWRGKKLDQYETDQASVRIKYYQLVREYVESARRKCEPCGHCSARFYIEPQPQVTAPEPAPTNVVISEPESKRSRTASDVVHDLVALEQLQDTGGVSSSQYDALRAVILAGR